MRLIPFNFQLLTPCFPPGFGGKRPQNANIWRQARVFPPHLFMSTAAAENSTHPIQRVMQRRTCTPPLQKNPPTAVLAPYAQQQQQTPLAPLR